MADTVKVDPNPIQRNKFDVAIELVNLHKRNFGLSSGKEIEELFAKYYALAKYLEDNSVDELESLIDQSIVEKAGSFKSASY
ncbi:hypothetical protein [Bacillus seohaeanensis]|uniref:YppF-like protein n=1 Tax=Bacillus seohaeanensis TaxID=284580 RepID=A0ABW5RSR6_9BACI